MHSDIQEQTYVQSYSLSEHFLSAIGLFFMVDILCWKPSPIVEYYLMRHNYQGFTGAVLYVMASRTIAT